MKHLKTFQQLNEAKIQDPRSVMSDEAWKVASKLRSVVLKQQVESIENPVYFVVRTEGKDLIIVIDEKMDHWVAADGADKLYYEEIASEDEIKDHKIS